MTVILVLAQRVWLEAIRRKDAYVLLAAVAAGLIALAGLDLFGMRGGTAAYIKELGLLLIWACAWVLAISVSVRQLPQEERQGTMFALLAKPVSRAQVVAGKWLGAWSVTAAATLVFYLALALAVLARGSGFPAPSTLAQACLLHAAWLAVVTAIGVAFSTRLHADAAATLATGLTVGAWLVVPRVPDLAHSAAGAQQAGLLVLYYALPHLELFDLRQRLAHGWPPAPAPAIAGALAYGMVMTAFFLLWACLAYRTKRLSRGALL